MLPLSCRECKSGAGLWEVLQLEKSYNLDEHLKTPKVRAGFNQNFWEGECKSFIEANGMEVPGPKPVASPYLTSTVHSQLPKTPG